MSNDTQESETYQDDRYCCMDCGCITFEARPGSRDRCVSCGSIRDNKRGAADAR